MVLQENAKRTVEKQSAISFGYDGWKKKTPLKPLLTKMRQDMYEGRTGLSRGVHGETSGRETIYLGYV